MLRSSIVVLIVLGLVNASLFSSSKHSFKEGDAINLKVNGLSSSKTHIPYEYDYLPFPMPEKTLHKASNLGELLTANHIENSVYSVNVLKNSACVLAGEKNYGSEDIKKFVEFIDNEYLAEVLVDNLPGVINVQTTDGMTYYEHGYPVGGVLVQNGSNDALGYALNNHLDFKIFYNDKEVKDSVVIVGFEIVHRSVRYNSVEEIAEVCKKDKVPAMSIQGKGAQVVNDKVHVIFTYSVEWIASEDKWENRFDHYNNSAFIEGNRRIHWYSIVNSLLVVIFLTGMVGFIIVRTIFQDFSRYNRLPTDEDEELDTDDSGWKMVHADVFRPPEHSLLLLSVLLGSGIQVVLMVLATITLALLGYISPENRGTIINLLLVLYVLFSYTNGYYSSWFYSSFGGKHLKRNIFLSGTLLPCVIFGIYICQNLISSYYHSTTAIPIISILKLVGIWLGLSLPLVFIGAYRGLRKEAYEAPVATSAIPREIPPQPWYVRKLPLALIGGLVPFGVVFVELYFFISSVWLGYGYYLFGFVFIVLFILLITTAEISIVLTYSLLCAENYNWWWMSFLAPASSGLYAFAFSLYYLIVAFNLDNMLIIVESVGYLSILCVIFSLFTGCVGFISSFIFVNALFRSVKVD